MENETAYKLRHIYLPGAALSVLLLAAYSALNWFVLSRTEILDEDVVDYWLPLLVAAGLELAFILPRVSRLSLGKKNMPFWFNCAAFALLAAPTLLGQTYIRANAGEMTHVRTADMIGKAAATRFYSADTMCLDARDAGAKAEIRASGSQNQSLDFTIYAVVPVCVPASTTYTPPALQVLPPSAQGSKGSFNGLSSLPPPQKSPVWLGIKFQKSVDNSLSVADKQKAYEKFAKDSEQALDTLNPAKYRYLERSGRNTDRRDYEKALASAGVISPDSYTLLIPHTEPFEKRAGDWLTMTLIALVSGLAVWLAMVMAVPLDDDKMQAAQRGADEVSALSFIIPTRKSYGLAVLIDLNVIVFLAMVIAGLGFISFDSDDLIAWGGNYGPALQHGEIYRLISSQFIHGGIMHLANNMYGLLIAGIVLSQALPNWKLILCYLITGLGGSITAALLHPDTVSIGASGAILGLWGVLVTLALLKDGRLAEQKNFILRNGAVFVVLTMVIGSFTPGIDNAAHAGGFATGVLVGGVIHLLSRRQARGDAAA
jgi:membrane associated rhomboid family serine protease